MPFTPFHMGFGLVAKAALDKRMSLVSFGIAQVLIDIEPGARMIAGTPTLHGWSHTVVGALCIGALATVISPWVVKLIVNRWNHEAEHYRLDWLRLPVPPGIGPVAAGAFIGTLSHIGLDGLMHGDMQPLVPVLHGNPLLGIVAHDTVYEVCAVAAAAGLLAWLVRKRLTRPAQD